MLTKEESAAGTAEKLLPPKTHRVCFPKDYHLPFTYTKRKSSHCWLPVSFHTLPFSHG
jgi:hypothetical protein